MPSCSSGGEFTSETDEKDVSGSDDYQHQSDCRLFELEAEEDDRTSPVKLIATGTANAGQCTLNTFPHFSRLPPEIRCRIWETFCPDMVTGPRALMFRLSPGSAASGGSLSRFTPKDDISLADQTKSLRRVLSTNRESRDLALKAAPDFVKIDSESSDGIVRFNSVRDVVCISGLGRPNTDYHLSGFSTSISQLAVMKEEVSDLFDQGFDVGEFCRLFPNLRRLFVASFDSEFKASQLRWCVSDYAHQYLIQTYEEEFGLGENTQMMVCWPNADDHFQTVKSQVFSASLGHFYAEIENTLGGGIEVWPLTLFQLEHAMERFLGLRRRRHIPFLEEDSSNDSENSQSSDQSAEFETDLDEYESDGIDDADLSDPEFSGDSTSEEDIASKSSLSIINDVNDNQVSLRAHFSSPYPNSSNDRGSGIETEYEFKPVNRSLRKRIIVDSGDDSASDKPKSKRPRRCYSAQIDSSDQADDSSDGVQRERLSGGASTAVTDAPGLSGGQNARDAKNISEDLDSESDVSHRCQIKPERSNKVRKKRTLSLRDRLNKNRQEIPVPSSDSESSDFVGIHETEDEMVDGDYSGDNSEEAGDASCSDMLIDRRAIDADDESDSSGFDK